MVDGGGGASFPVIFFDGETEINIGTLQIHPTLEFKTFQLMISQRIGIYPNQILIYLVRMVPSPEERPRIPITAKVNFAFIVREKGCSFYVILKRSKRLRDWRLRPNYFDYGGDYYFNDEFSTSHSAGVILRRNQPDMNLSGVRVSGYQSPFYNQFSQEEMAGCNDRLQNLMIQSENYEMAMVVPPMIIGEPDSNTRPGSLANNQEPLNNSSRIFCEECANATEAKAAPFHFCANDQVIKSFKTRAGPIARPLKYSG